MGDELLAEYASSVLANIKPSNLFTVSNQCYDVDGLVEAWNEEYNAFDIYFRIVAKREKASSVLCYRRAELDKCINSCKVKRMLKANGYEPAKLDSCIDCVSMKLCTGEFPHEIGLFLGYPYEDVKGFIDNNGRNYLGCGYWKVYHNLEEKEKLFDLYHKTRLAFKQSLEDGVSIKDLVHI